MIKLLINNINGGTMDAMKEPLSPGGFDFLKSHRSIIDLSDIHFKPLFSFFNNGKIKGKKWERPLPEQFAGRPPISSLTEEQK